MPVLPVVRNLRFDTSAAIPRHWHGGRRSVTTFFDNLSVFFPIGERFFVSSVHAHESRVSDPALRAAVRAFCGQEGVHSREHVRYNAMLAEHGYPIAAMEARVGRILGRVTKRAPLRTQLAVTCALEHFTALLGQLVLNNPGMLDGADETMAALWRWHSAEENEHKAVAYDVYQAVGGTYRERTIVMVHATVLFWAKVFDHQARMMKVDGTLWSPQEWARLGWFLFVEPGGMGGVLRHYFDYFRPDFHPDDLDCQALFDAWKATYRVPEPVAA